MLRNANGAPYRIEVLQSKNCCADYSDKKQEMTITFILMEQMMKECKRRMRNTWLPHDCPSIIE